MAKEAQLRREEREPREFASGRALVEADALRKGLAELSNHRVQDTLLAEARAQAPLIEKFRGAKAEHNEESLAKQLDVAQGEVRATVRPLVDLGFLEEAAGTYKVPMLYRGGLGITQGKAFETESSRRRAKTSELDE